MYGTLKDDSPCYFCPSGHTALDGKGRGTHELLNPGSLLYLSQSSNLMKLFFTKSSHCPDFATLFRSLDTTTERVWTNEIATWAVAHLYRKAFVLPNAGRKDKFKNCHILTKELLDRRGKQTEPLDHSQTKTIGDNLSFLQRWNERNDLQHFRETNILRCVDELLNPPKKIANKFRRR